MAIRTQHGAQTRQRHFLSALNLMIRLDYMLNYNGTLNPTASGAYKQNLGTYQQWLPSC